MTRTCSRCQAPATHIPRLDMFAFSGASKAVMFFDYPVCRLHHLRPADLVTDDTWKLLVVAIVEAGKLAPRRELNRIELVPIRWHEAREFYRRMALAHTMKVQAPGERVH